MIASRIHLPWLISALAVAAAYAQDPPPRPTFEVASVKPSGPPTRPMQDTALDMMFDSMPIVGVPTDATGTRVTLKRRSLATLIAMAHGVRVADVSGPSWMSEERFEIDALVPKGTSSDVRNQMMLSLLEDRFALKAHWEKKPQNVMALLVAKGGPKLKPFKPNSMPEWQPGQPVPPAMMPPKPRLPQDGGAKPAPWIHLNGATMADLAHQLSRMVGERVVDMTGLKDRYEITLEGTGRSLDAQEGTGPSIFDAIKDLGLRLESRKADLDIVVVDSVARKPTEN